MNPKLLIAPCALTLLLAGCREKIVPPPTTPLAVENSAPTTAIAPAPAPTQAEVETSPTPVAPAKSYRVRGQVIEVPANGTFLVVKHENIPGFMRAMQMRVPLQNAADAQKVKPGDKIVFDMNADTTAISNIAPLPPATELKIPG